MSAASADLMAATACRPRGAICPRCCCGLRCHAIARRSRLSALPPAPQQLRALGQGIRSFTRKFVVSMRGRCDTVGR